MLRAAISQADLNLSLSIPELRSPSAGVQVTHRGDLASCTVSASPVAVTVYSEGASTSRKREASIVVSAVAVFPFLDMTDISPTVDPISASSGDFFLLFHFTFHTLPFELYPGTISWSMGAIIHAGLISYRAPAKFRRHVI